MTDDLDSKCDENQYRKKYGNLKQCVLAGTTIMKVFTLDGSCFKLNKPDEVKAVFDAGDLDQEGWDKYCEGRKLWEEHQAKYAK